jgi:hypothetical protein
MAGQMRKNGSCVIVGAVQRQVKIPVGGGVYIHLCDEKLYNEAIIKVKQIDIKKDSMFVIESAKVMLNAIEKDYNTILNDMQYNELMYNFKMSKQNILNEYNETYRILNEVNKGVFSFSPEDINYYEYDFWKDFYVRFKAQILFRDWFISDFSRKHIFVNSAIFSKDYFSKEHKNKYFDNFCLYSFDCLIKIYYYKLCDLTFNNRYKKEYNAIEKFIYKERMNKNILLFWSHDEIEYPNYP